MGIVADDIRAVRHGTDIVALIGQHTEIKRSGRSWMARCPLHGERTPSLSVSPDKGVYYCFGCGRSGDAITFVQEMEGFDFIGAVEMLAGRAGITLRYTSRDEGAARTRRKRLLEAVAEARDFYHESLKTSDEAGPARHYLRSRGYDGDLVRGWRIGWSPSGWDVLSRRLTRPADELRDAGLGRVGEHGPHDFFRGRIMFPITDERGDTIGFGGRAMPDARGPKYMNTSADSKVYDKSKVLYGLYEHRSEIVRAGEAVICEGYTDVIGCSLAGVTRAVATCGTALTEDHVRLLNRYSANRLVLAFDADTAGLDAAGRVYEWERKYELEVLVARLPDGEDPGDLARSDPEALRQAVTDAVPFLQFRVDRVLDGADTSTYERRVRAAERAVLLVGDHPNDIVRDHHVQQIAERCRIDPQYLRRHAADAPGSAPTASAPDRDHLGEAALRLTPEDEALMLAIQSPEIVGDMLDATLFGDPRHREAFEALQRFGSVDLAAGEASPPVADLMRRLAVQVDAGDPEINDVLAGLARLAVDRAIKDLVRMAGRSGDPDLAQQCNQSIVWLKSQSERLGLAEARGEVLEQLLPWLIQHARSLD